MDLEVQRFGRGHREIGGACDLINQYKLLPYHEFFCKRSLPLSIAETHYLHDVVGNTKIKKGEGMELDQLFRNTHMSEKKACLHPFDLDVLSEAFHMREMDPIHQRSVPKGLPTAVAKLENQSRGNERKNRKDKGNDRKGEKHRKHRLRQVKDGSFIDNNRIIRHDSHPLQLKNLKNKKRRADASKEPSVCKGSNTRQ